MAGPLLAIPQIAAAAGPALAAAGNAARVGLFRNVPRIRQGIQTVFDRPSAPAGFQDAVNAAALREAGTRVPGAKQAVEDTLAAVQGKPIRKRKPRTKRQKVVAQMQGRQLKDTPRIAQAPPPRPRGPADVPTVPAGFDAKAALANPDPKTLIAREQGFRPQRGAFRTKAQLKNRGAV